MDTKWNSTDKSPFEESDEHFSEGTNSSKPRIPAAKAFLPGGRIKAFTGFLAFFLGMTLALSALGALGNRIAWERDPSPRWEWDWQKTDVFRDNVSQYLREFLTIGAGGVLDFYGGEYYWDGGYSGAMVEQEAVRSWWGFGEVTEAVVVDRGTLDPVPPADAEKEPEKEPDAAYQADKNVLYWIQGKETSYTNGDVPANLAKFRSGSIEGYNFYLTFQNGKVSITKDGQELDVYGGGIYNENSKWFVPGYDNFPVSEELEGVTVYMAVRRTPERYYGVDYKNGGSSYYGSAFYSLAQWVEESESFYKTQGLLLFIAMWCLVVWVLLRKSAERVNREIASWTRHVWTEARFLLVTACLLWALLPGLLNLDLAYELLYSYGYGWEGGYSFAAWGMAVLRLVIMNVPALLALFWLWWLLRNDHRHNPRGARRSLLRSLFRALRTKELKRPVEKRLARSNGLILLVLLLGFALSLFPGAVLLNFLWVHRSIWGLFLSLLGCVLEALLVLAIYNAWKNLGLAKDIAALADQVEAVRAGDLSKPLKLPEDADLRQTAESFNDIQAGMKAALEEQTRSERMKVELVSNVSHDLKTPLTSILSYAELLRQEENLPPAAEDYARIIDEKAQRLKSMVEDVFEVSKAAADQLPVHLERLDMGKLLRQTLADMDGAIQRSALAFRVELPEEPVMITADGKRLYRVFQNLIDNALRYALEGSRVYLSLKTAEGLAEASVRNTSRSELPEGVDFTARFVRGDASRTDGGSGLGLSIASSFVEACGGEFRVETVADLFTAIVTFRIAD